MNHDSLRPADAVQSAACAADAASDAAPLSTNRPAWHTELLESYTTIDDLLRDGILSPDEAHKARTISARFRVRLPRYYASLMDLSPEGRDQCPIRKQAVPTLLEQDPILPPWAREWSQLAFGRHEPWTADAIGDFEKLAAPRITHRYDNRAIVHLSSLCALYCRFCFRKEHLNDDERALYEGTLEPALQYVTDHSEIREVILTGGDPLSMKDVALRRFLERLAAINHVRHVRIHSRMAATLPSRLTDKLAETLTALPFLTSLVSHFNHPRELSATALAALARMRRAGIPLYNQSVLLAGVNDDFDTLQALFQGLYESGVTPFYLHHPDWTPGTFGFRVSIEKGRALMRSLEGRLSGPALPRYVLDIPGGLGKVPLAGERVELVETKEDENLHGALYRIRAPHTRAPGNAALHYAEFWRPAPVASKLGRYCATR